MLPMFMRYVNYLPFLTIRISPENKSFELRVRVIDIKMLFNVVTDSSFLSQILVGI